MIEIGRCGYCKDPLPDDAVSDYFCNFGHQQLWHMQHSEPLDEYQLYLRWEVPAREARIRAQQAAGH